MNEKDNSMVKSFHDYATKADEHIGLPLVNEDSLEDKPQVLKRSLKARHIQMISIGGTIGTGLFVGSGKALAEGGPAGALLGYGMVGTIIYCVMMSLGEIASFLPTPGAFTEYATRFVDPALGFAMGWNYWYSYAITLPAELVAAGMVVEYWTDKFSIGLWILIFYVIIVVINFLGVKLYGEFEFWFSLVKVLTIIGLILLGIILDAGVGQEAPIGFKYWKDPGPFANLHYPNNPSLGYFIGFWNVMIQAAFSYLGTEIIAVSAGETANPRKNVPRAIKNVFVRILIFYMGGLLVVGWLVPANDPKLLNAINGHSHTAAASPFVMAIENANIKGLTSVINAVILVSAISAGNSDLYASSRTLFALSNVGLAPKMFSKVTKKGLPINCIITGAVFALVAFIRAIPSKSAEAAFGYFVSLSTISGLFTWIGICVSFIRFHKAYLIQGNKIEDLPYRSPGGLYGAYYAICWVIIIITFNGYTAFLGQFNIASFVSSYIDVPIFLGLLIGYKLIKKTKMVPLEDVDLVSGVRDIDELDWEEDDKEQPTTWYGKLWTFIV